MKTKNSNKAQSDLSKSSQKSNNNSTYFERLDVPGTPFSIVSSEKGSRIAIGNQIISQKIFENEKLAKDYVEMKPWELLINGIGFIIEKTIEYKKLQDEKNNSKIN